MKYLSFFWLVFVYISSFSQDLRPVVVQNGVLVYKGEYGDMLMYHNQDDVEQHEGKWGYVNKKGKLVIPVQYDDANYFSVGLACVKKNDKYGFIDSSGNQIIYYLFDEVRAFDPQCEMALVCRNGKWGWINKYGDYVVKCRYDIACPFSGDESETALYRGGTDMEEINER